MLNILHVQYMFSRITKLRIFFTKFFFLFFLYYFRSCQRPEISKTPPGHPSSGWSNQGTWFSWSALGNWTYPECVSFLFWEKLRPNDCFWDLPTCSTPFWLNFQQFCMQKSLQLLLIWKNYKFILTLSDL